MKYEEKKSDISNDILITVTLHDRDRKLIQFSEKELETLHEYRTTDKLSDKLLGLVTIAKKLEEVQKQRDEEKNQKLQ